MTSTALPAGASPGSAAMQSSTPGNQRSPAAPDEVAAAQLADGHDAHAGGGAVLADGAVEGVGARAELVHVAEDGDRGAPGGDAHEMVDGGHHGHGIGVVGVVEEQAAAGQLGDGAAQVAEGDLRGAVSGFVQPVAELDEGGQRGQRVLQVVASR